MYIVRNFITQCTLCPWLSCAVLLLEQSIWQSLLFYVDLRNSAAKSHRMQAEAYIDSAFLETTCRVFFCELKKGSFNLVDKERENRLKKIKTHRLQGLMEQDDAQSQNISAKWLDALLPVTFMGFSAMRKVHKLKHRVPVKFNDKQIERRINTGKMLPTRRKRNRIPHWIVTRDE